MECIILEVLIRCWIHEFGEFPKISSVKIEGSPCSYYFCQKEGR